MAYKDPAQGLAARRKRYGRERNARRLLYHRERKILIASLGGKCSLCPCTDFARLEFDHTNGRDYDPAGLSRLSRLRRYREEARQGTVRLLCRPCNAQDGGGKRATYCP